MYSEAKDKLQEKVQETISDIDKNFFRKYQGDMHRCAAVCCDDVVSSPEHVQRCIENCSSKFNAVQNFVRGELENFQDRLNRCHMACSDKVRDKLSATPSESEIQKYRGELDRCANKCAETHLELISQIYKRTKEFHNSFV